MPSAALKMRSWITIKCNSPSRSYLLCGCSPYSKNAPKTPNTSFLTSTWFIMSVAHWHYKGASFCVGQKRSLLINANAETGHTWTPGWWPLFGHESDYPFFLSNLLITRYNERNKRMQWHACPGTLGNVLLSHSNKKVPILVLFIAAWLKQYFWKVDAKAGAGPWDHSKR